MTTQRCPTGTFLTSVGLVQETDGSLDISSLGCSRTILSSQFPFETQYRITNEGPDRTLRCTNGTIGYGVQPGYNASNVLVGLGLFCRNVSNGEVTGGVGSYEASDVASWGRLWTVDRDEENKDLGLGAGLDGFVVSRNGADAITSLRPLINIGNPGNNMIRQPASTVPTRTIQQIYNTDGLGEAIREGFDRVVNVNRSNDDTVTSVQSMSISGLVLGVVAFLIAMVALWIMKQRL